MPTDSSASARGACSKQAIFAVPFAIGGQGDRTAFAPPSFHPRSYSRRSPLPFGVAAVIRNGRPHSLDLSSGNSRRPLIKPRFKLAGESHLKFGGRGALNSR